jgi:hypothetical protein
MNVGRTSTLVGALIAGALAPACGTIDDIDAGAGSADTETTQGALTLVAKTTTAAPATSATLSPTINLPQYQQPLQPLQPLQPATPPRQVCGKTVRITSADLDFALRALLFGTRIVYDTTGVSDTRVGPYYHCWYPNNEALQNEIDACLAGPPQDKGRCLEEANELYPNVKECAWTSAAYHSYIDFGQAAQDRGAEDMFFDSDKIRRVNWAGTFDFNINFVRTTIDNTTISGKFTKDPASDRAIANIALKLSSNNPTIICEGGLPCPDVNLSNMVVNAQLTNIAPSADRTQLVFDVPEVTFNFSKNINNLPDWFIDLFKDVDGLIRSRVEKRLESALKKEGTRASLNDAITQLAEHFAHEQIFAFYGAWFENGDMVVDYQPESVLPVATNNCMVATQ